MEKQRDLKQETREELIQRLLEKAALNNRCCGGCKGGSN